MSLTIVLKSFNFRFTVKFSIDVLRHRRVSYEKNASIKWIWYIFSMFAYNAMSTLFVINYSDSEHKMGAPDRLNDRINRRTLSPTSGRKRIIDRLTNIDVLFFFPAVDRQHGDVLNLNRVSRADMGSYLCIASNGVPPSVSKRIVLDVECKYAKRTPPLRFPSRKRW